MKGENRLERYVAVTDATALQVVEKIQTREHLAKSDRATNERRWRRIVWTALTRGIGLIYEADEGVDSIIDAISLALDVACDVWGVTFDFGTQGTAYGVNLLTFQNMAAEDCCAIYDVG